MTVFALGVPPSLVARVDRALRREGLRIEDHDGDASKSEHHLKLPEQWLDVVEGTPPTNVPRVLAYDGPKLPGPYDFWPGPRSQRA